MTEKLLLRLEKYPELLTTKMLIEIGLYSSINAAHLARIRGSSPDYVKYKHKILYPKIALMEFVEKNFKDGSVAKNTAKD